MLVVIFSFFDIVSVAGVVGFGPGVAGVGIIRLCFGCIFSLWCVWFILQVK